MDERVEQSQLNNRHVPTWRSHRVLLVCTVAFGIFCETFLYGIIIPILPSLLEDRLGIPPQQLRSYTSAMLTVSAGCSLLATLLVAYVADRLASRKAPFLMGLVCMIFVSTRQSTY